MNHHILYLIFLVISVFGFSQNQDCDAKVLQKELVEIFDYDQSFRILTDEAESNIKKRNELAKEYKISPDSIVNYLYQKMEKTDSMNLLKVENMIKECGFPEISKVGLIASNGAWAVIHHSDKLPEYIDVLKIAAENKELSYSSYASSLDRVLMHENKPQIYGTQANEVDIKDPKTGLVEKKVIIWPVENQEKLNELRKSIGLLPKNIRRYATSLGIKYKVYTMDDIVVK